MTVTNTTCDMCNGKGVIYAAPVAMDYIHGYERPDWMRAVIIPCTRCVRRVPQ